MEARNQWGWGRQSDVFKFFTRTKGRYLVATMMGEYFHKFCGNFVPAIFGLDQELRDGHREFEVYIYLQKGCIIVSGVESS